ESSAFSDSNLLSGWISYLRADYRDSLINESHSLSTLSLLHAPCPTPYYRTIRAILSLPVKIVAIVTEIIWQ
ncbi:MAG: hypothetical protein V7K82_01965, partial [Nostoc sp.]